MDHWYKYFRWLSLDIVLGAIFFLTYLGKLYHLSIGFPTYFAMSAAIWLIYTIDHLMDAWVTSKPTTERHAFHHRNFKTILLVSGIVLMAALINIHFMKESIIRSGAILSAVSVAYLMLVYFVRKLWVKEIIVALVYAAGIFLAPVTLRGISIIDGFLFAQLAVVAFLNLIVFSLFDYENDRKSGFNSLALRLGAARVSVAIRMSGLLIIVSSVSMIALGYSDLQMLYLLMTSILLWVHYRPVYFSRNERFRVVGDGIFYLPLLFLLF